MTVKKISANYQARARDMIKFLESDVKLLPIDNTAKIEHINMGIKWLRGFLAQTVPESNEEPIYLDGETLKMHPWVLLGDGYSRGWEGMDDIFTNRHSRNSNSDALWLYQDSLYEIVGFYSLDEQKLLVLEYVDRERKKFERLQKKFSDKDSDDIKYERTRISEEVRITVWRRDQGKCARCGNRENLEYDHIVPVSKGGSNTARNIELLCQNCNRAKGNRIEYVRIAGRS